MIKVLHIKGVTNGQKIDEIADIINTVVSGNQLQLVSFSVSATKKAADSANNYLGDLCLHANNRVDFIGKIPVHSSNDSQNEFAPYPCNVKLLSNSQINGYYIDKGNAEAYPYDLRIYLNITPISND